jgi:hypothetical protein
MFNSMLEKAILKSQRCQRNFDLSRSIPEEDINTLKVAVTQCSSKQNRVFYKAHFITNRDVIQQLYDLTDGFMINFETRETKKNPQVLANLVVAFSEDLSVDEGLRTTEEIDLGKVLTIEEAKVVGRTEQDVFTAVGIAAGYLTYTANLLGYSTGCCQCFSQVSVGKVLGEDKTFLLMGIGFPNKDKNRRIDQTDPDFVFPSHNKVIKVNDIR